MGTKESEIIDSSLEEYDAKVHKATADLCDLKYERNLRVPVCRLPVEILARILVWTYDSFAISYPSIGMSKQYFPVVLSVCRLWRTVAFDTPAMWSKPNFAYPKFAEVMMGYAKSAPLQIYMSPGYSPDRQMSSVTRALQQANSSSVYLHADSFYLDRLLALMVKPEPRIQSVDIICFNGVPNLPSKFLGDEAPRLTYFSIYGVGNAPWNSPILARLTTLHVTSTAKTASGDLTAIAETLRTATSLQDVRLNGCLSSQGGCLSTDIQVVLPRLVIFRISSQYTVALATLLRHITFPETASLDIDCTQVAESGLDALRKFVSIFFSSPPTVANSSRRIEKLSFTSQYGSIGLCISTKHEDSLASFQCRIDLSQPESSNISALYTTMFNALSSALKDLQILTIDLSNVSQEDMIQHFGKLQHLHTIRISLGCRPTALRSLAHGLDDTHSAKKGQVGPKSGSKKQIKSPQTIVFPALKDLEIKDVDFDEYHARERTRRAILLPTLTLVLRLRSLHGVALETVTLETCLNLCEGNIDLLKRNVPDTTFEWDAYVPTSSEESEDSYLFDGVIVQLLQLDPSRNY